MPRLFLEGMEGREAATPDAHPALALLACSGAALGAAALAFTACQGTDSSEAGRVTVNLSETTEPAAEQARPLSPELVDVAFAPNRAAAAPREETTTGPLPATPLQELDEPPTRDSVSAPPSVASAGLNAERGSSRGESTVSAEPAFGNAPAVVPPAGFTAAGARLLDQVADSLLPPAGPSGTRAFIEPAGPGRYVANAAGFDTVALRSEGATLVAPGAAPVTMQWAGANAEARAIATREEVRYVNVYDGIDVRYYATSQGRLEYDLIVAPGVDPSIIRLGFDGIRGVGLDGLGNLRLNTGTGTIQHSAPVLYQEIDGLRQAVTGSLMLTETAQVRFAVGAYDPTAPLVIDPVIDHISDWGYAYKQLREPDTDEHNYYYWRSTFNADNTLMTGIQERGPFVMVLYDANTGEYLRDLFSGAEYNWRGAWSRTDPTLFYVTSRAGGNQIFQVDVTTATITPIITLPEPIHGAGGPSLNEAGTRIMAINQARTKIYSYDLSGGDERIIDVAWALGEGVSLDVEDCRYTGDDDWIAVMSNSVGNDGVVVADDAGTIKYDLRRIADENGTLVGTGGGHWDFSPDGQFGFLRIEGGGRFKVLTRNVADDPAVRATLLYTFTNPRLRNAHLSWPDAQPGWFLVGLFPQNNVSDPEVDRILRITTDGVVTELVTVAADVTSYSALDLASGTPYWFRVRAVNLVGGTSDWSNTASATTDGEAGPAAPSNLTAAAISRSQIDLAWIDNSDNETGFEIERATNPSFTGATRLTVGADVTSYSATDLAGATTYWFRVRARNDAGVSAWSNTASATTPR